MLKVLSLRNALLSLSVLITAVVLLWPNHNLATPPAEHHINMNASQFEFTPGRLDVNQGDRVVINLHATDVVHGFYLDGYGIETRVNPGVSQRIQFTADQTGKFHYRCSVTCGPLHPFMIGELVVRPNNPFWKAVSITLISLIGLLTVLWQGSKERM